MQKTVFILGAGASAESGAPLMSTFLDRARDLLAEGAVEDAKDAFTMVFQALVTLREVFYKSGLDLDNIESVFGAFEIARIIGKLGDYSLAQIDQLARSIRTLIVRTLDESIKYSYVRNEGKTFATPSYTEFAALIKSKTNYASTCSVLTFNYDVALDCAFMHANIPYDYCIEPPPANALRLLKLHGSLNWGRCPTGQRIQAEYLSVAVVRAAADRSPLSLFTLPSSTIISQSKCEKCSNPLSSEPVIVPPTWNKTEGQNGLPNVWRQAAVELSEAENIICLGYSLPETDLFFRYLFALGTVGDAHLRRLWVFDPDPGNLVAERYRRLIGKGIERGFRFFNGDEAKFGKVVVPRGELRQSLR
jgi:NAD-dependent SIR2 family protein deacetylase